MVKQKVLVLLHSKKNNKLWEHLVHLMVKYYLVELFILNLHFKMLDKLLRMQRNLHMRKGLRKCMERKIWMRRLRIRSRRRGKWDRNFMIRPIGIHSFSILILFSKEWLGNWKSPSLKFCFHKTLHQKWH